MQNNKDKVLARLKDELRSKEGKGTSCEVEKSQLKSTCPAPRLARNSKNRVHSSPEYWGRVPRVVAGEFLPLHWTHPFSQSIT